jgi:tRNA modification GTPase
MLTDPIAALATPPGRSAIAVIRLSGTGTLVIAERVVRQPIESLPDRTATLLPFYSLAGTEIDRGLVTVFRSPNSYTGHDLVEFSCHGGLLAPAELLAALFSAGARLAAPGEFTRRAVLNGKLDLLQAEAVGDLIDATAPAQGRAALRQLDGQLSRRILALREELLELLAVLAYDIDFPEEDDGPVPRERMLAALASAEGSVARLLAGAPAGERLHDGALVVLAGRPNAGKSSLFNALLGSDRALVTEIPGTTRDTIEAATDMEGWPVRLADTAGLREAEETIERLGIEVSRRYLAAADLVLLCVEADRPVLPEERELLGSHRRLLVRTKADLVGNGENRERGEGVRVSVVTGEGLDQVRHAIAAELFGSGEQYADPEPLLSRERHRVALERAASSLSAARPELESGGDPVLSAHHVKDAVAALDEMIGLVHPDEVLGRVFERFCVGK